MTFSKEQQRLNYEVFERLYIAHVLELYTSSQYHQRQSGLHAFEFAVASALEGLGWLSLGASVGYFADNVVRAEIQSLRRRDIFGFLGEYVRAWGYLFDQYWLETFRNFSNESTPALVFELGEDKSLGGVFQSCLVRAVRNSRNPSTEATMIVLDFDRPDHIQELIRLPSSLGDVAEALEQGSGLDKNFGAIPVAVIYAGFGTMVRYLDNFRQVYHSGAGNSQALAKNVSQLLRRIAQLQAWRFHFICATSLEDLQFLFVSKYLEAMDIKERERQREFRQYLKDLALFWRNFETPRIAEASGGR